MYFLSCVYSLSVWAFINLSYSIIFHSSIASNTSSSHFVSTSFMTLKLSKTKGDAKGKGKASSSFAGAETPFSLVS